MDQYDTHTHARARTHAHTHTCTHTHTQFCDGLNCRHSQEARDIFRQGLAGHLGPTVFVDYLQLISNVVQYAVLYSML